MNFILLEKNVQLINHYQHELNAGVELSKVLTSHFTQFRSFQRRCLYRSDDPNSIVRALKEGS